MLSTIDWTAVLIAAATIAATIAGNAVVIRWSANDERQRRDAQSKRLEMASTALISEVAASRAEFRKGLTGVHLDLNETRSSLREDLNNTRNSLQEDINNTRNSLQQSIDDLAGTVSKVKAFLSDLFGKRFDDSIAPTIVKNSPIMLSHLGLKFADELHAKTLVGKYIGRVEVNVPADATKLQVQNLCFKFANTELSDILEAPDREAIEEVIYTHGGSASDIWIIFGVLFRDAIFTKRGIEVPKPSTKSR